MRELSEKELQDRQSQGATVRRVKGRRDDDDDGFVSSPQVELVFKHDDKLRRLAAKAAKSADESRRRVAQLTDQVVSLRNRVAAAEQAAGAPPAPPSELTDLAVEMEALKRRVDARAPAQSAATAGQLRSLETMVGRLQKRVSALQRPVELRVERDERGLIQRVVPVLKRD